MDEAKVLDLLEKIYIEVQSTKSELHSEVTSVKSGMSSIKSEMTSMKSEMTSMKSELSEEIKKNTERIIMLEDNLTKSNKTLYDGYIQNSEMLSELKDMVQKNTEDIEDLKITVSGMKEDINFIAGKLIRNDSKIDKLSEKLKAVK